MQNGRPRVDLMGRRFGRLLVIEKAKDQYRNDGKVVTRWICQCDCGIQTQGKRSSDLTSGNIQSCGCYRKEFTTKGVIINVTHGLTQNRKRHPVYNSWSNMISRCTNSNNNCYQHYGGRGIMVCERWLHADYFIEDMLLTYQPGLSIERIDNDGPYSPDNCRWATVEEQRRNMRSNRPLTFQGETLLLTDWAKRIGLSVPGLWKRLDREWSTKEALSIPLRGKRIQKALT